MVLSRNGARMSDRLGEEVPSETAQAWDDVRRVREPVAWTLLVLTAIIVLLSACQLFNLAGAKISVVSPPAVSSAAPVPAGSPVPVGSSAAPVPAGSSPAHVPVGSSPAPASAFSLRASAVAPQFIQLLVQALPVLAVVLVAFSGGLTERARQVVQTATVVLAVAFVLGLISLAGAADSHTRPGTWFILEAAGLAITATALLFTVVVFRSRALTPQLVDFGEDDEDFGQGDVDPGGGA
jgi:hypothetical protein